MKVTVKVEKLDCASCASKLERAVCKMDGVTNVNVNFMTSKMTVETADAAADNLLENIKKHVKKIMPDVELRA